MNTFLDAVNTATNIAYITVFISASILWAKDTYPALVKAARRYWLAAGLAGLAFIEDIASIPYDGPWWLLVSGFTATTSVFVAVATDNRRDAKFEETVREWWR